MLIAIYRKTKIPQFLNRSILCNNAEKLKQLVIYFCHVDEITGRSYDSMSRLLIQGITEQAT
jgi:hypothetical protein